jgi:hypothetical protein
LSFIEKYDKGVWTIESLIGEGGFGKVYKISKEEYGCKYFAALKVIPVPQTSSEVSHLMAEGLKGESLQAYIGEMVEDIMKEIRFVQEFEGTANIISYEDHKILENDEMPGYSILLRMELLDSLEKVALERKLTEDDTVRLGIDICRALELLARNDTIHRDVKPDNIFLSKHGDYKLGDFGIARQIERTMSGLSKKGTLTFMAPEVFKSLEYGASVDLYSLGLVMHRILNNGRMPFLPLNAKRLTPSDREEALNKRMSGLPIPPPAFASPDLSAIILKACAYDRKNRFRTAADMREALESYKRVDVVAAPLAKPIVKAKAESKAVAVAKAKADAKPVVDAKGKAEAKPVVDAKGKAEAKAKAEAKPVVVAKAKADAKPVVDAKGKADLKPVVDAKAKAESKPVVESKAKAEAKPVVDAKAKAEPKPVVDTKGKAEAKPVVEAKGKAEPKPVVVAKAKAEPKPVVVAKAKAVPEIKPTPAAKPVLETKIVAELKLVPGLKSKAVPVAKKAPEAKAITDPKAVSEVKPASESKPLSESKPALESKAVPAPEIKLAPEAKPEPESKAVSEPEPVLESIPVIESTPDPEVKAVPEAEAIPESEAVPESDLALESAPAPEVKDVPEAKAVPESKTAPVFEDGLALEAEPEAEIEPEAEASPADAAPALASADPIPDASALGGRKWAFAKLFDLPKRLIASASSVRSKASGILSWFAALMQERKALFIALICLSLISSVTLAIIAISLPRTGGISIVEANEDLPTPSASLEPDEEKEEEAAPSSTPDPVLVNPAKTILYIAEGELFPAKSQSQNIFFGHWGDYEHSDWFGDATSSIFTSGIGMLSDNFALENTWIEYVIPQGFSYFQAAIGVDNNWRGTEEYGTSTFKVFIDGEEKYSIEYSKADIAKEILIDLGSDSKGKLLRLAVEYLAGSSGTHAAYWGNPRFVSDETELYAVHESEGNDTPSTANAIKLNSMVIGNLRKPYDSGEKDWYEFTLDTAGFVGVDLFTEFIDSTESYWNYRIINYKSPESSGFLLDEYILGNESFSHSYPMLLKPGKYYFDMESSNLWSNSEYKFRLNFYPNYTCERVIENGLYVIQSAVDSTKVIDCPKASMADEARMVMYSSRNGNKNQQLFVTYNNGYYGLEFNHSLKSMDVPNGTMDIGGGLIQNKKQSIPSQDWLILPAKNGCYYIVSRINGAYLTASTLEDGAQLVLAQPDQSERQMFKFSPVSR